MSELIGIRKKRAGEFPIPPAARTSKPIISTEEEADDSLEPETPVVPPKPVEIDEHGITEDDRNRFLEAILFEQPYVETHDLFGGKLKCSLRTRLVEESEAVIRYVRDSQPEAMIDVEVASSKGHLAFALTKLETTVSGKASIEIFDSAKDEKKTLQERIARIDKFPVPKYTALVELLSRFDRKVAKLQEESLTAGFSHAGDGR